MFGSGPAHGMMKIVVTVWCAAVRGSVINGSRAVHFVTGPSR